MMRAFFRRALDYLIALIVVVGILMLMGHRRQTEQNAFIASTTAKSAEQIARQKKYQKQIADNKLLHEANWMMWPLAQVPVKERK
jgi:hypothetical protein